MFCKKILLVATCVLLTTTSCKTHRGDSDYDEIFLLTAAALYLQSLDTPTGSPTGSQEGDSFETAILLEVAKELQGQFTSQNLEKYYRFTLNDQGSYQTQTTGNTDTFGYLYNSEQTELQTDDNSGADLNFLMQSELNTGTTYYIKVRSPTTELQEGGNYTLSLTKTISGTATVCNPGTDTTGDPLFSDQWHLKNTGQNGGTLGEDANIEPVWAAGNKGEEIRIAVIDDGLDIDHEDLCANVPVDLSYNYVEGNTNPDSPYAEHGTAIAGVIAGRDLNDLGVRGVASRAQIVGYNLLRSFTDINKADAMVRGDIHIANNSWGPADLTGQFLSEIEFVEVTVSVSDHPDAGDLSITLLNPAFTTLGRPSFSHPCRDPSAGYTQIACGPLSDWTFGIARFLNESANGNWGLRIKDLTSGDTGTFQSWKIKIYGRNE